ncbi:MAG: type 2 isopentenyl-diphosphate Delta-isomerase [Promethearchaeota archaeon]
MVTSSGKTSKTRKETTTEERKLDHIRICLEREVQSACTTGFDDIRLVHNAVPEINFTDVDLSCSFLGHKLEAPIIVTAMTGGHSEATPINQNIAQAVDELGLAMGVGSQRAAIEDPLLAESFAITREYAPKAFLVGNIGAPQLSLGYGVKEAQTAIDMIDANALAIHFNAAQEAVQPEGEATFAGVLPALRTLTQKLSVPVIAKETGAGLSREVAVSLARAGVRALDVAGLGGTSWPAVEVERAKGEDTRKAILGRWFTDWGIPTAVSTFVAGRAVKIPIISSGGIRTGIECAKAIALGATLVGVALPVLGPAATSSNEVSEYLKTLIYGLKAAMFLVGASNLRELNQVPIVIGGNTRNWLELRGWGEELHWLATRRPD